MLHSLDPLIQKAVKLNFSAGSTIFYQGEVPRSACILIKGGLRVYGISPQGDEQIVSFTIPGECFPMSWIFEKTAGTLFFYETIEDSVVAFVDRKELVDFIAASPDATAKLVDYFATYFAASLMRINALEQPKARDKLVYTLYFLCQRYGQAMGTRVRLPIQLTHQNLASMVGLTRETTAVEMHKLKKEGIISYKHQLYIINRDALLHLMGEESFHSLSIKNEPLA